MASPVVEVVETGHWALWVRQPKGPEVPTSCREDGEAWPCRAMIIARNAVRRQDKVNART